MDDKDPRYSLAFARLVIFFDSTKLPKRPPFLSDRSAFGKPEDSEQRTAVHLCILKKMPEEFLTRPFSNGFGQFGLDCFADLGK